MWFWACGFSGRLTANSTQYYLEDRHPSHSSRACEFRASRWHPLCANTPEDNSGEVLWVNNIGDDQK